LRLAAIDALKALQRRLEESVSVSELRALPDLYVLLIEVGTWGFFRATESGFDPDCTPEPPEVTAEDPADRDAVFIATESLIQAMLEGRISVELAFDNGLIVLDGGAACGGVLRALMDKGFPVQGPGVLVEL
jgi:hypothetical protein